MRTSGPAAAMIALACAALALTGCGVAKKIDDAVDPAPAITSHTIPPLHFDSPPATTNGSQTGPTGRAGYPEPGRRPAQKPAVNTPPGAADDSRIYHTSEDFGWLEYPGKVVPGGRYINLDAGKECSAGWIVTAGARTFILTAGHCGDVGDRVAIPYGNGRVVPVGRFVESRFAGVGYRDDALIELNRSAAWTSTIPLDMPVTKTVTAQWVDTHQPQLCRLGFRTGLSCGSYLKTDGTIVEYRNIADHGDSGGPTFALLDGELYAVGVESYGSDMDATRAGASAIAGALDYWGLTLHS